MILISGDDGDGGLEFSVTGVGEISYYTSATTKTFVEVATFQTGSASNVMAFDVTAQWATASATNALVITSTVLESLS